MKLTQLCLGLALSIGSSSVARADEPARAPAPARGASPDAQLPRGAVAPAAAAEAGARPKAAAEAGAQPAAAAEAGAQPAAAAEAGAQPAAAAEAGAQPAAAAEAGAQPAAAANSDVQSAAAAEGGARPAASGATQPAAAATEGGVHPAANAPAPPAQRFRRWTPEEIARVRAALARQRQQIVTREVPYTPGDSRAHFTLGLEVSAVYRPDSGFERFENSHWSPRFGIFAAIDLLQLRQGLSLFTELGATLEHDESNNLFGPNTSAELSSQTLQLGLGLRWEALSWLSPQLRLSGGASLFQLDVKGTDVAFDTGHATSALGTLGAGFILHTPARAFESNEGKLAALRLGLLVEAGYALRSSIDFSLRTPADPRRIEVVDASLGSLSLSGGYLRFAAVLRF